MLFPFFFLGGGGHFVTISTLIRPNLVWTQKFKLLGCLELPLRFPVLLGGVESNFSVQLLSKLNFCSRTWDKLKSYSLLFKVNNIFEIEKQLKKIWTKSPQRPHCPPFHITFFIDLLSVIIYFNTISFRGLVE